MSFDEWSAIAVNFEMTLSTSQVTFSTASIVISITYQTLTKNQNWRSFPIDKRKIFFWWWTGLLGSFLNAWRVGGDLSSICEGSWIETEGRREAWKRNVWRIGWDVRYNFVYGVLKGFLDFLNISFQKALHRLYHLQVSSTFPLTLLRESFEQNIFPCRLYLSIKDLQNSRLSAILNYKVL